MNKKKLQCQSLLPHPWWQANAKPSKIPAKATGFTVVSMPSSANGLTNSSHINGFRLIYLLLTHRCIAGISLSEAKVILSR
jgi:hypothetical protein